MAYKSALKQAEALRDHYIANQVEYKRRARIWTDRQRKLNRKLLDEYLLSHPCVDCSESDIVVLEFDHIRGKKLLAVSAMASRGVSTTRLLKEIEKCDVRCANCHRRQTVKRRVCGTPQNENSAMDYHTTQIYMFKP